MSELNTIIHEYLKVVANMKDYVAEQLELGFLELTAPFGRMTMEELRAEVMACTRCELHKTRQNVVFGEGNENADLVFIGEAPGGEEDQQGRPFVGAAGQLLTKIIEAMKFTREEVYIANVLKCRPPNNRDPLPNEVNHCKPFLTRQLEIIKPKIICVLGAYAARTLINSNEGITRMRGKFYMHNGIKVMPTFHPAYLLRNESAKRPVWTDAQKIMAELSKL
ncbi:uracil-DNA glycosylase [bacterium]|nr:uracil-DNA glycosylase [bacterium]